MLVCGVLVTLLFSCATAANTTVRGRYYPRYHFAPPYGWMNDPNGLCKFKGSYHLFYQFNPTTSLNTGNIHWGHAKSPDWFHWEHLPIALYPNNSYDSDGVYSGGALIEDETMYLFYTGNVDSPADQEQALAISIDGENIEKYAFNPLIKAESRQPNIRDPQVWKHDDTYYMILGNSFNSTDNQTLGRVLLYTSKDKLSWTEATILAESNGTLGYMWECPTFFQLGDHWVLLFSPQGVQAEGDLYQNTYQTGYIIGDFEYDTKIFTQITQFREMDCGHDYYATQMLKDDDSTIVMAWFSMWEYTQNYLERYDGFAGSMVLPRNITLGSDNIIYQSPINTVDGIIGENLYTGAGSSSLNVTLPDKTAEIKVKAAIDKDFTLYIASDNQTVSLTYNVTEGKVILNRGGDNGIRRRAWKPDGELLWRIFVDASSVELFCGKGDITFSSRFFPTNPVTVRIGDNSSAEEFVVNAIKRTVDVPEN